MTEQSDAGSGLEQQIPIDLTQPLILDVHNPDGDVTIRAADRNDVLVSDGGSGPGDDEPALTIDVHDNRIEVHPALRLGGGWAGEIDLDAVVGQITKAFHWGGPWSAGKPGKVRVASGRHAGSDIVIEVPRAITGRFGVHTASGDVRVEGVNGEIALTAMSGDVRVVHTGGNLVLRTASGDLVVEGASGRLAGQTASGDVRVGAAQIDGFDIQTANGDIHVDALLTGDGPCRARTASGDVRLTLRRPTVAGEEPAATLAFQTVSGDAHVTPPFRKTDRRRWQTGPGDRGPRIEVTTVSGDLSAAIAAVKNGFVPAASPSSASPVVPAAPPAPPAPPTAPAPPVASWPRGEAELAAAGASREAAPSTAQGEAARLAVLEAVERGEIDVEEALRRLEAADFTTST